jgi:Phosphodiester glycosidase
MTQMLHPPRFSQRQLNSVTIIMGLCAVWLWAGIVQERITAAQSHIDSSSSIDMTLKTELVTGSGTGLIAASAFRLTLPELVQLASTPRPVENITRAIHLLNAIKNGVFANWHPTAVRLERRRETRVWLAMIHGGHPVSRLEVHRTGVAEFVAKSGAVAGINGGFFVDASMTGTNNTMIGPVMTERTGFQAEYSHNILGRVQARPLVLWGAQRVAILPFDAETMNSPELLRALMPDISNVFLGGAWILRHGQVITAAELERFGPADANDVRPRVFFGLTANTELVLGASLGPTSSSNLARAALAAGVHEAVLLDSGYSTSLVYDSKIIAVGRKTALVPSRPVPHAIVVMGVKELAVASRASSQGRP